MNDPLTKVSIACLALAKLFGIIGVVLGYSHRYRVLGGCALGMTGLLLVACVSVSIMVMRAENKKPWTGGEVIE